MKHKFLWIFILATLVGIGLFCFVPELNLLSSARISAYDKLLQTGNISRFIEEVFVPSVLFGLGIMFILMRID